MERKEFGLHVGMLHIYVPTWTRSDYHYTYTCLAQLKSDCLTPQLGINSYAVLVTPFV